MKNIGLYLYVLIVLHLVSCAQKETVEVPLVYHPSFPIDVEVKMEKIPISPETKSTWELYVVGNRMLLSTSEMDNSDDKYAMFNYPEMEFIGYVGSRSEFARGTIVTHGKDEFFLKHNEGVEIYQLVADTLQKISSLELKSGDYPAMRRLDENRWIYENDIRTEDLYDFYMYNSSNHSIRGCGVYPNVQDRYQFKDVKAFKGAYMHGVRVKPDGNRVLVFYNATRRYRIYDNEGTLLYDGMMDYSNPSSALLVSSNRNQLVWHYESAFVTDKYIYLLCMDRVMSSNSYNNPSIQVMDWEGNPVARFRLDAYITAFYVDEDKSKFYGVSATNPGFVFTFDIGSFFNKV